MKRLTLEKVWNSSLNLEAWPVKKREYIRASELGKPYLDRWYSMKGIEPTNPFEERVRRVFAAGDQFHWLIRKVFEKAGLVKDFEGEVKLELKDALPLIGHYDILVGGIVDWDKARKNIKEYGFSEPVEQRALKLVDYLEKEFKEGVPEVIYEVKSVNSIAFWGWQNGTGYLQEAYEHHKMQLYAYLLATGIKEGRILYVSKDDLTLLEHVILLDDDLLREKVEKDINEFSKYWFENKRPPKEPDIVFDEAKKKWKPNWKIERSLYLTKITGLSKEEWLKKTREKVNKKNKKMRELLKTKK